MEKVLMKADSQNTMDKKEVVNMNSNIKEKSLVCLKNRVKDVQMDKAIQYCAGSEELYIQCLKDYGDSERRDIIEQSYAVEDWKRYAIEVHALKSTSRTLGFDELGNMAEKMQAAAETQDISYIRENHKRLLEAFEQILQAIGECL